MEDMDRIEQLKYRYCRSFDEGDLDALIALFAADAVCELDSFGTWRGVGEIRAGFAEQMVNTGVPGRVMHVVSNPLIDIDGDHASAQWYLVDYSIAPGETSPVKIIATYDDEYRCENGEWLFARTSLRIRWRRPA